MAKTSLRSRAPVTQAPAKSAPDLYNLPDSAMLRIADLVAVIPLSRASIWRLAANGQFPPPVKLSQNVTCWTVGSVRTWLAGKVAA